MNGIDQVNKVTFTIFGGTGDLTFRKLLPALYNAISDHKLDHIRIVSIGRRSYTSESYRKEAKEWVKQYARLPYRDSDYAYFASKIEYVKMDFTDIDSYAKLADYYQDSPQHEYIFYFAVAPRFFEVIAKGLSCVQGACKGKVIIEKPFGEDLPSARMLNKDLEAYFGKDHVFHIDHYLGKEMVRNMQVIRFMNPIFEDTWNANYIEQVQIRAFETVGVENRGDYYDHSGALKDMVQNHLFQILSIVAMERPAQFFKEDMHVKQLEVLKALRPVEKLSMQDTMVLGQYFHYQKEERVENDSMTETYAALRLYIDNARWSNVPFIIRTGKKLDHREMEVIITFKQVDTNVDPNVLIIKIQPTEGVYFQFHIKEPGSRDDIMTASMDFCQSCSDINRINTPEAYERLLQAVVQGDTSWFSKWDQIEESWQYIDKLKARFYAEKLPLTMYMAGSKGPKEAESLLHK